MPHALISQMQSRGPLPTAGTQPSLVSVPAGPGHKSVQEGTQVLNAYSSAENRGNGSQPRKGQEILLAFCISIAILGQTQPPLLTRK